MNFKTSEKGSIIIVVSVMVAIILVMLFVIIYENNKEKNQPKQEKIQKEIKINKNIENDENLNTDLFKNKKSDLGLADRVLEIKYQYFGDLVSIFDDKKINNITLRGDLNGGVKVSYLDNSYLLIASFKNLPDLKNNSFYNGWLVKEGGNSLSIINTGKAIKVGGVYMNSYTSEKNLTDYNFYILSIEENNNKEPSSRRILGGEIKVIKK